MTSLQRVIKNIAIGFAIFLTVVIIGGIASAVFGFIGFAKFSDYETHNIEQSFENVTSIDAECGVGEFNIEIGDSFAIKANNVSEEFKAEVDAKGVLKISEKKWNVVHFFGFNKKHSAVTLYLPEDFVAEKISIKSGVGELNIGSIQTQELVLKMGTGEVLGNGMSAQKVEISGGVGELTLKDVDFKDANIRCGVGEIIIDGIMTGDTEVHCGVGDVELNLIGNVEDYDLDVDKGLGDIEVNGESYSSVNWGDHASNHIDVDGGLGDFDLNFR